MRLFRKRSDLSMYSSIETSALANLVIDLAHEDTMSALSIFKNMPCMQKHTRTPTIKIGSGRDELVRTAGSDIPLNMLAIEEVFGIVASLPKLKCLSVDFAGMELPVAVLTVLFGERSSKSLNEVAFKNVHFIMDHEDDDKSRLDDALLGQSQLTRVSCHGCSGDALSSFMMNLTNLRKLEMGRCQIGERDHHDKDIDDTPTTTAPKATSTAQTNPFWKLGQSQTLTSLTLVDMINLQNNDILTFTEALSASACPSPLQELHLICGAGSTIIGEQCGMAIADLFTNPRPCNIRTLTLKLGPSWTSAGSAIARILKHHSTKSTTNCVGLSSLCLELPNNETACQQSRMIFRSLHKNTSLKRLKIRYSLDMWLDGPLESSLQQSMVKMLHSNHHLQSLVLQDDNGDKYSLNEEINFRLELNASKIPLLLRQNQCNSNSNNIDDQQEDYVRAIIDSKDSINVVFYALYNNPGLLLPMV